jgi:hypothetical protein
MPDREYSSYQQKIIRRYYDNRDQMDEQRLSELVANLYLASGKKRAKLWETARELMGRLNVPASRIEHVVKTGDAAILAEVVKDIAAGKIRPAEKKPHTT